MFVRVICVFFFFKQKTAYEMRISDWSSDVCSSDLQMHALILGFVHERLDPAPVVAHAAEASEMVDRRADHSRDGCYRLQHHCAMPMDRKSTRLNSSH